MSDDGSYISPLPLQLSPTFGQNAKKARVFSPVVLDESFNPHRFLQATVSAWASSPKRPKIPRPVTLPCWLQKNLNYLGNECFMISWVGCVCVCVCSVYARYFGTTRRIEGQGLFVSPEAQPAPTRCHPASRQLRWHQSAAGDARGTLCICLSHV